MNDLTQTDRLVGWENSAMRAGSTIPVVAPDEAVLKLEFLQETEIFAPLSPSERAWLMENTVMVTCERGKVFYTPDEVGEVIFILKQGKVHLYRLTSEGRKLIIATLGPNTIFGEMGLIGQRMYRCFAEAAEDCLLYVLNRADMEDIVRRNPEVGLLMLAEMERRLQSREADLEAVSFHGLPSRLAALLLNDADSTGAVIGKSHQDLAERLGTYRETVSEILGRFRREGLVTTKAKQIQVLDADRLDNYVNQRGKL